LLAETVLVFGIRFGLIKQLPTCIQDGSAVATRDDLLQKTLMTDSV
jgi:hypothetical protein